MKTKKLVIVGIIIIFFIVTGFFLIDYFSNKDSLEQDDFELDTLFLKVVVSQNGTTTNPIKIKNYGVDGFSIKVNEIPELVDFNEMPELDKNGESTVEIIFNAKNTTPGVYLGELEISSGETIKIVPIILEVQSKSVLFDSNINLFPQGTDLVPGQRLNAEIKIFDLTSIGKSSVQVSYFIKDFKGRTIISESDDRVIDSGDGDFSKSLDLPSDIKLEDYVLAVIVSYGDSVGTSTVFFKVASEKEEITENLFDTNLVYIFIIFGLFFILALGLFIYLLFSRDTLLKELQGQYKGEIRRQRELINSKGKTVCSKLKDASEKREYKKELEKIKKQRLNALEMVHKGRLKQVKEIKKKKGGKKKLVIQLKKWKNRGYDTDILEKKYKMPSVENIKNKIRNWKQQGYDTKVLNKHLKKDK